MQDARATVGETLGAVGSKLWTGGIFATQTFAHSQGHHFDAAIRYVEQINFTFIMLSLASVHNVNTRRLRVPSNHLSAVPGICHNTSAIHKVNNCPFNHSFINFKRVEK